MPSSNLSVRTTLGRGDAAGAARFFPAELGPARCDDDAAPWLLDGVAANAAGVRRGGGVTADDVALALSASSSLSPITKLSLLIKSTTSPPRAWGAGPALAGSVWVAVLWLNG